MTLGSPAIDLDLDRARRVLADSGIEQAVPRPRLSEWWWEVVSGAVKFLAELLDLRGSTVRLLLQAGAWVIIAVALLALLWMVLSWRRRNARVPEEGLSVRSRSAAEMGRMLGPAAWSERLQSALARGDVRAAVEAIWFLAAQRLGLWSREARVHGGGAEWTGGGLIAAAGPASRDLEPSIRWLERLTYGPAGATLDEVSLLWRDLDEKLSLLGTVGPPLAASCAGTRPVETPPSTTRENW